MTSAGLSTIPASASPSARPDLSHSVLSHSTERWRLLLLLFTAIFISYVHRGALSVAAPFISEELGLSKFGMGLALSAFYWSYAFLQVPAGWVADRFGPGRPYSLGFIGWSMISAMTGLAPGLGALLGLRVALGAGQAITFPASCRAVADWFQPRERGTVTGIYLNGMRLGNAAVIWIGAYFLARYSWKLFFLVTGVAPFVWLLPWTKFVNKWEPKSASTASAGPGARRDSQFFESLLLLKQRSVLGLFLGCFAYGYAWYVFISWLPGYLLMERHFTPSEMGLLGSMPFLVMAVISVLSGLLSDWLVRLGVEETKTQKLLIVVGLGIGCLIVPAGLVADRITAVWLLTISLAGLGITSPHMWTLPLAVCERQIVGTVSGIQNLGGNLGGIIAPALTGLIAQSTGSFALALGVTGAVLLTGIPAYWFLVSDKVGYSMVREAP
jgi:ACS family D-galactonate transporter-like MFS transporter